MDVNGKVLISPSRAFVVQLLSCRATVTVARGHIGKSLRTIAGIVLSQSTVSRAHIRRDAAIQQPVQKLPIAIGRIGCDGCWLPSLPLDKAGEHVLCSDRLL